MSNASARKQASHRYGLRAENIARLFLRCKGYRILAQRYRNHAGEIDLIASKGNTLVAVEVKARRTLEQCEDTVPLWKQQKIARALEGWIASQLHRETIGGKITGLAGLHRRNIRFDAVWIAPKRWPRHIKDAWRI